LVSILERASLSRRLSAATPFARLRSTRRHTCPAIAIRMDSLLSLVWQLQHLTRSYVHRGTPSISLYCHALVQPSCLANLLEPRALPSMVQFCSRNRIRALFPSGQGTPARGTIYTGSPGGPSRLGIEFVPSVSQSFKTGPFSLFFFSISTLRLLFHSLSLPFFGTSVLPFCWNVPLPSGYVPTIGLVVALGIPSSWEEGSVSQKLA
jgi:hypothetical protein